MLISKVAEQLSKDLKVHITENDIRFYERQDVYSLSRANNNYRDITDKEMAMLRTVFMLLKLGTDIDIVREIMRGDKKTIEQTKEELKIKQNWKIREII